MNNEGLEIVYELYFEKGDKFFPFPSYIGYTSNTIDKRIVSHKKELENTIKWLCGELESDFIETNFDLFIRRKENHERRIYVENKKYFWMASFMLLNDLEFKDLKFRVLEHKGINNFSNVERKIHNKSKTHTPNGSFLYERNHLNKNDNMVERLGFNDFKAQIVDYGNYLRTTTRLLNSEIIEKQSDFSKQKHNEAKEWYKKEHSVLLSRDFNGEKWKEFKHNILNKIEELRKENKLNKKIEKELENKIRTEIKKDIISIEELLGET